jgi:hypothetical protein
MEKMRRFSKTFRKSETFPHNNRPSRLYSSGGICYKPQSRNRPPHRNREKVMEDQANHPHQGPHWRPRLAGVAPEFEALHLVIEGGEVMLVVDKPEMVAGRHSEADIRLPLPDVSRRHCRFSWEDGHWTVADLGSLNGVWVNHRNVQHAVLEAGDKVRIGGFTFVVHLPSEVAEGQPSLCSLFKALPRDGDSPRRIAS